MPFGKEAYRAMEGSYELVSAPWVSPPLMGCGRSPSGCGVWREGQQALWTREIDGRADRETGVRWSFILGLVFRTIRARSRSPISLAIADVWDPISLTIAYVWAAGGSSSKAAHALDSWSSRQGGGSIVSVLKSSSTSSGSGEGVV